VSSNRPAGRLRLMTPSWLPVPKAILFDMDGTFTKPMLDFPKIKAEIGIGSRPILEALAEMDGAAREEAERVLHRHETHAATESELNAGCDALFGKICTIVLARARNAVRLDPDCAPARCHPTKNPA
jgi:hypothetical protein